MDRVIDEDEQMYLDQRIIADHLKIKLIKKLRKCSEIIDEMGHTPSRQYLEERINFIIWDLKECFEDEECEEEMLSEDSGYNRSDWWDS
jgi:hypothetical protein